MQKMQDLAQRQRELLDQSFRELQQASKDSRARRGSKDNKVSRARCRAASAGNRVSADSRGNKVNRDQQGKGQQGQGSSSAAQQEALRRELGEIMRQLGEMGGEIPRPSGPRGTRHAGRRTSSGARPARAAVAPQTQALDELQQGLQSMAEQMAQQMMMGQQPGQMPGQQPMQQSNRGRDPLGRPSAGLRPRRHQRCPHPRRVRTSSAPAKSSTNSAAAPANSTGRSSNWITSTACCGGSDLKPSTGQGRLRRRAKLLKAERLRDHAVDQRIQVARPLMFGGIARYQQDAQIGLAAAALSASAMPSTTGMTMSAISRSKRSISSACKAC